MPSDVDYTEDILEYLRNRREKFTETMRMVSDLSRRVRERSKSRQVRGKLLSSLATLIREQKVIRYRRVELVNRRPRSAQGYIRISEVHR